MVIQNAKKLILEVHYSMDYWSKLKLIFEIFNRKENKRFGMKPRLSWNL
jgi:hypothetical protein